MKLSKPLLTAVLTVGALSLGAGEAQAWPWSNDMVNQQSVKPQEQIRPFPSRSVPTVGIASAEWADRDATESIANPVAVTDESLKTGKMLFTIYCTACHGQTGRGEGEVAARGMPAPDLTESTYQDDMTDGWMFGTITFGSAMMPPYGRAGDMNGEARGANDLSVTESWHVVNYIKHQLVADAKIAGPLADAQ